MDSAKSEVLSVTMATLGKPPSLDRNDVWVVRLTTDGGLHFDPETVGEDAGKPFCASPSLANSPR